MTRVLSVCCAFLVGCAAAPTTDFLPAEGVAAGFTGLERVGRTGTYEVGALERFKAHVDSAQVQRVEWLASAGVLTRSSSDLEWTLPDSESATLTARVVRKDGGEGSLTWTFSIARKATTLSAHDALLVTPMPVLDGGTLEISGGACDLSYEGTSTNVSLAFTTGTHPAVMFGRWNGSAWALEVVDAMGFNTGGVVRQHVQLVLGASNQPHVVYVKDNQVWWATKSGGVWTRERVDSTAQPLATTFSSSADDERSFPSMVLNGSGAPVVLYPSGQSNLSTNRIRPILSTRTAANAWTQVVAQPTGLGTSYNQLPTGDLVLDGQGRYVFPVDGCDGIVYSTFLVGWSGTSGSFINFNQNPGVPMDAASVSGSRVLYRAYRGLFDIALNATFTSTTFTFSSVEESLGSFVGDLGWAGTRPVVLHQHGGLMELVTTNASNFWTYAQYGTTTTVTASLAVHPTSGEVSVCYQSNDRIMFQ